MNDGNQHYPDIIDKPECPDSVDPGMENSRAMDLEAILTTDITRSGSFDLRSGIWATTFGKLIQALPIPAFLLNADRSVVAQNDACQRICPLGATMVGRVFPTLFQDLEVSANAEAVFRSVLVTRKPAIFENLMTADTKRSWARMTLRSIRVLSERYVFVLVEDLTVEKRQLEENESLRKSLEERVLERTAALEAANSELRREIEQKRIVEVALRESEQKLDLALRCSGLTSWDWNIPPDEPVIRGIGSRSALGVSGLFRRNLLDWREFIHPDDRPHVSQQLSDHFRGVSETFESEYRTPDDSGSWKWILARGKVTDRDQSGAPIRMTGTHLDITQSKKAQDALRRTERKFQDMVELLPQPVFELDSNGKLALISGKGFELFGYSREELDGGVHFSKLLILEDVDRAARNIQRILEGESLGGQEYTALRKDGSTFPVLAHAALTKLDDGTNAIRGVIADLTSGKQAEELLRKSEARYRDLVDNSPDLVFTRDARRRFTAVNSAIFRILGYSPDEFLTMDISLVVHAEFLPMVERNFQAKIEGVVENTGPYEIVAITKDGRHVWLDFNSRAIRQDNSIIGVHVTARNVSDRKRAEQISRQHTEELEAINSLGREINSSLSLAEIVDRGLATVISVIRADCAMLFLRENDDLILQGSVPGLECGGPRILPIHKVGECICGLSVREGKALFSSNINHDPRCAWNECKEAGLRSIASIPLVDSNRIFGILAVGSYSERDFSAQTDFIQSLAHEINLGLKNSLLFEEVKKHANELEEKLAELKGANEAKELLQSQLLQAQKMEAIGRLAGGIAHDFNNLLTVMVEYSDMLRAQFPANSPQAEKLLQIGRAADRASSLTRQLLAFSRKQVLDVKVIDLCAFAQKYHI